MAMKRYNEIKIDLSVEEGFSVNVKDSYTCTISGTFDKEELKDIIAEEFDPDDVYSEEILKKWAEENGYVPE